MGNPDQHRIPPPQGAESLPNRPIDLAKRRLDHLGLRSQLPAHDKAHIITTYGQRLREAVAGNTNGLKMVDTLINPEKTEGLFPPNKVIWAVDMGGTNLRVAAYQTTEDGRVEKMKAPSGGRRFEEELYSTIYIDHLRQFPSVHTFAELVADRLIALGAPPPDACGYIFSFSGKPVEHDGNIDVQFPSEMVPNIQAKGFSFPGIDELEIGVGHAINQALARKGIPVPAYTIMNDTPVLPLSTEDASLGVVVGTGANHAFIHRVGDRKILYNTALPSFHEAPTHELMRRLDPSGKASAFKEIGGLHHGDLMRLAIEDLQDQGLLQTSLAVQLTTREVAILADTIQKDDTLNYHPLRQLFKDEPSDEELDILRETSRRILIRSAELMGTFLGTLIATFPDDFKDQEVVPAMGSVFWAIPQYESRVKSTANDILATYAPGKRIAKFTYKRDASMDGVVRAALGILQKKEEEQAA